MHPVPDNFKLIHDIDSIQKHIGHLVEDITPWAREVLDTTGKPVLALCVLRGGVLFFSDLLKAMPISIEPCFCRCRSYSSEENATQLDTISTHYLETDFKDRDVLIIDDICDSGKSLRHLTEDIMTHQGAKSVKTVTFIFRDRPDSVYKPDWHALTYGGDEWFVGYGMEDKNLYMNHPHIHIIEK